MKDVKLIYRLHALKRMIERNITKQDIKKALNNGVIIKNYPSDMPYPSKLIMGYSGSRPLHVVYAENKEDNTYIIITVYEPSSKLWDDSFRKRED